MQFNGTKLNTYQANFLKELMGDILMSDTRASAILAKTCAKYDVDSTALIEAVNKNFAVKNAAFKKAEEQVTA